MVHTAGTLLVGWSLIRLSDCTFIIVFGGVLCVCVCAVVFVLFCFF